MWYAGKKTMKVVSSNIWIDGHLDEWQDFLRNANADIIGLQEVKDDDPERDVIGFLTERGYHHVFARTEQFWGRKVVGDADPACAGKASLFTPVPAGVGPVAIAHIYVNVFALKRYATIAKSA
jgi:hypothetical protein